MREFTLLVPYSYGLMSTQIKNKFFLKTFRPFGGLMREAKFVQKHVKILMEMKMEKHKNLWEEGDFYWGEIYGGSFQFDRVQVEVIEFLQM